MRSRWAIISTQLHHGRGVAEAQLQPAGVLRADQPVLEALHGEGDGRAGRDGVERVAVAQLVGLGDGLQVVDAAVRAEPGDRLVLRPAVGIGCTW